MNNQEQQQRFGDEIRRKVAAIYLTFANVAVFDRAALCNGQVQLTPHTSEFFDKYIGEFR